MQISKKNNGGMSMWPAEKNENNINNQRKAKKMASEKNQ